jgi:hypothetical protein
MAWIRVESSVARNRKFVKAGPGPSWLWLCGLAYCQEGLTDGFIPSEALDFLGVRSARNLAKHLVSAGLWDEVDGGWRVHDYLDHNRSASEVDAIRAKRSSGGKLGGRPIKNLPDNLHETSKVSNVKPSEKPSEKRAKTHAVDVAVDASVDGFGLEGGPGETDIEAAPMDVWARELVNLYPSQGRCSWHLVEPQLFSVLTDNRMVTPEAAWEALKTRLEGHKRSHQWRVKEMIPRLDRYLRDGMHLQELPEAPVTAVVTDKTARTLSSAANFAKRHGPA